MMEFRAKTFQISNLGLERFDVTVGELAKNFAESGAWLIIVVIVYDIFW